MFSSYAIEPFHLVFHSNWLSLFTAANMVSVPSSSSAFASSLQISEVTTRINIAICSLRFLTCSLLAQKPLRFFTLTNRGFACISYPSSIMGANYVAYFNQHSTFHYFFPSCEYQTSSLTETALQTVLPKIKHTI